jgi:hypothetical protein
VNIGEHSKARLLTTFANWQVDKEYADPMYNYLVFGFSPGSFFTSVLANDFVGAIQHSHPANSIPSLKKLVGWLADTAPRISFGDYDTVNAWLSMEEEHRYIALLDRRLIYSKEDELMLTLKGERAREPILW